MVQCGLIAPPAVAPGHCASPQPHTHIWPAATTNHTSVLYPGVSTASRCIPGVRSHGRPDNAPPAGGDSGALRLPAESGKPALPTVCALGIQAARGLENYYCIGSFLEMMLCVVGDGGLLIVCALSMRWDCYRQQRISSSSWPAIVA